MVLDFGMLPVYHRYVFTSPDFTQPRSPRAQPPCPSPRSLILASFVLASNGLLRLKARDDYLADQFAAPADDERLYAERWPVAGPVERAWIREASAYTAMVKAECEW